MISVSRAPYRVWVVAALLLGAGHLCACSKKAPPSDENLLANASFEDVRQGLPARWKLENFRGLQDVEAATYGVTDSLPHHGQRCFFFKAGVTTERFHTLTQEVWVKGARRVRVRGALRTQAVGDYRRQYPQSGFALTYYNDKHERFESERFADVRTSLRFGSTDRWVQVEEVFRLPLNTAYVVMHCVLGMQGNVWFDDVSLDIPEELPWHDVKTGNFVHYWLEKPYPEGSIAFQQQMFDSYAQRLGIPEQKRPEISYYFYPDTTALHAATGVKTESYVDSRRRQIHSIHPVEDHEIVHFLTQPYGTLPTVLMEGTAFYLMDNLEGARITPLAQELLRSKRLAPVKVMVDPSAMKRFEAAILVPSAATFIGFLVEGYGAEKFLELHRIVPVDVGYDGFAQAVETAYGKPLTELEAEWIQTVANGRLTTSEKPAP